MWFLWILAALVLITLFYLRPKDLAAYDYPPGQSFARGDEPNTQHRDVEKLLATGMGTIQQAPRSQRLRLMREYMDGISASQDYQAEITPVNIAGMKAEWVLAPGVSRTRRALYIHGGAFMMGSPISHRNITSSFSRETNAAVLAIDYRLMPENRRLAGVDDCRAAYLWILQNGPAGIAPAERIYVGGDSAGGNLTLSLLAWARDQNLRSPDAAVALSPATDTSFGSPSLKRNLQTDVMLGPMFKRFMGIPRPLLWWAAWIQSRVSPGNPVVSPVFGDLSGLPPTLVHASEAELLHDDGLRYVNRAVVAGSPAKLQTWGHMVHVWHMFYPQLTEAQEAWDEIGAFIAQTDAASDDSQGEK